MTLQNLLAARMEASRLFWEVKKAERRRAHTEEMNRSAAAMLWRIAGAIALVQMVWRFTA